MFDLRCETDWLVYADYLEEAGRDSGLKIREQLSEQSVFWEYESRRFGVGFLLELELIQGGVGYYMPFEVGVGHICHLVGTETLTTSIVGSDQYVRT